MSIKRAGLILICVAVSFGLAACTSKQQAASTATPGPALSPMERPVRLSPLPFFLVAFRTSVKMSATQSILLTINMISRKATRGLLQRQATWLNKYPRIRVTVEGHCDSEARANIISRLAPAAPVPSKEYLIGFGVAPGRITTVSYGKERPLCTQSTEECWAQNRRSVTTNTSGTALS